MTLAARQAEFMAQLLDEEQTLPAGWTGRHAEGLAIYRNNYRTSLVETLRSIYERTAVHVGEGAFRQAAAHHLITHPPLSWTLDGAGEGFHATVRELFARDPEVAELAWLEGAMHTAFVAADDEPLDVAGFARATSAFRENDWSELRLRFAAGIDLLSVEHDIPALWRAIDPGGGDTALVRRLDAPMHLLVWREGTTPVFRLAAADEGEMLAAMRSGVAYGDACAMLVQRRGEEAAIAQAGAVLGCWLRDGLVAGVSLPAEPE